MASDSGSQADPRVAARRELGESLRGLLDGLAKSPAEAPELHELAATIRAASTRWEERPAREGPAKTELLAGMSDFMDRSPIVGLANPIAPPARYQVDREAGEVRGEVSFGNAYEGAPGIVHGGFLSAVLDEVLGVATVFSGGPGMTAELTTRYHGHTPTHTPLEIRARLIRVEGRRLYTSGEFRAGERVTCSAEGLFIAVDAGKFEELTRQRDADG